jgi:hypothetical protein
MRATSEAHTAQVRDPTQSYAAPVERQYSVRVNRAKGNASAVVRSFPAQPVATRPVAHRPGRKVRLEHSTLANRAGRDLCQELSRRWRFVTVFRCRFFAEDCG